MNVKWASYLLGRQGNSNDSLRDRRNVTNRNEDLEQAEQFAREQAPRVNGFALVSEKFIDNCNPFIVAIRYLSDTRIESLTIISIGRP